MYQYMLSIHPVRATNPFTGTFWSGHYYHRAYQIDALHVHLSLSTLATLMKRVTAVYVRLLNVSIATHCFGVPAEKNNNSGHIGRLLALNTAKQSRVFRLT